MSGAEEKIEAFIDLIQPYGIVELARTGVIAMPRAQAKQTRARLATGRARAGDDKPAGPTIDPGDLPPG